MAQKAWIRFGGPKAAIIARVDVPKECPAWFAPVLAVLSEHRKITMEDISVSEWIDYLCSNNRAIPVYKPLSVRSVPDSTFIKREDFDQIKIERDGKVVGIDPEKAQTVVKRIFTGSEIREFLKKDESRAQALISQLVPIEMELLGRDQPYRQETEPMISYLEDDVTTARLVTGSFLLWIETKEFEYFEKLADEMYAPQVEKTMGSLLVGPGSV